MVGIGGEEALQHCRFAGARGAGEDYGPVGFDCLGGRVCCFLGGNRLAFGGRHGGKEMRVFEDGEIRVWT